MFQELKRERAKAAAALKSLQEKLEEKYKTELEQKVESLVYASKSFIRCISIWAVIVVIFKIQVDNLLPLQQREAEYKLEKVEELAKAELAAKIVSEKAAQLERIAEANLNVRYA